MLPWPRLLTLSPLRLLLLLLFLTAIGTVSLRSTVEY